MANRIRIIVQDLDIEAELNETETARKVWDSLPIESTVNLWGNEIYFSIPFKTGLEPDAREIVSVGELGYWPTGHAFCIFFGPTPISRENEIRAASKVNIIGKILSDPKVFLKVKEDAKIVIKKVI